MKLVCAKTPVSALGSSARRSASGSVGDPSLRHSTTSADSDAARTSADMGGPSGRAMARAAASVICGASAAPPPPLSASPAGAFFGDSGPKEVCTTE